MSYLKEILKDKNLNQAKLSGLLNKDKTTINRWCKNNRKISWDNVEKIAKVLNIHPLYIFEAPKKSIIKFYIETGCELKKYKKDKFFIAPYELRNCIIVDVENFTHQRGKLYFENKPNKINELKYGKFYLVYAKNKIYCGSISFDQNPYTGEVNLTDILNHKKINIGDYKNIDNIYECIFQTF